MIKLLMSVIIIASLMGCDGGDKKNDSVTFQWITGIVNLKNGHHEISVDGGGTSQAFFIPNLYGGNKDWMGSAFPPVNVKKRWFAAFCNSEKDFRDVLDFVWGVEYINQIDHPPGSLQPRFQKTGYYILCLDHSKP
jgi:hypothetical protein